MGKQVDEKIRVWIKKDAGEPDGVKFSFTSNMGSGEKLKFKNPTKGDWFKLNFNIIDEDETGYRFPNAPGEAMWVHKVANAQAPCPPQGSTWDQFEAVDVINDNKTLVVVNENKDEQLFKFALRFSKEANHGPPYIMWDPIGDNRDGGSAFISPGVAAAVALIAGAVIGTYVIAPAIA